MIPVAEAQARLLALAAPLSPQILLLDQAFGHYLSEDIFAKRNQPAADLSAMDGYAIRFADLPGPLNVIGESAAGKPFTGDVDADQAVRIFTGAHVPEGADTVLIQEDAVAEGKQLFLSGEGPNVTGKHIRRAGGDFCEGDRLLAQGALLTPGAIAAAAMGGYGQLSVGSVPKIKIIGSGDELLPPGTICDAAHIPSSNNVMLAAMLKSLPCGVYDAGIVGDDLDKLTSAFADRANFDIIVTSGGASVGDHDLVQAALLKAGAEIDFWRVAMRPGKPLMAGRLGSSIVLGLPGNPSSAFATAFLFLLPLVRHLAGSVAPFPEIKRAKSADAFPKGQSRAEYIRARVDGEHITACARQDSGMITPLIAANALLLRPAHAPPVAENGWVDYLSLAF
ncbi:MAG: molybdopterin molybdotransferase MoeA [Sphingorhabdus sp.]